MRLYIWKSPHPKHRSYAVAAGSEEEACQAVESKILHGAHSSWWRRHYLYAGNQYKAVANNWDAIGWVMGEYSLTIEEMPYLARSF